MVKALFPGSFDPLTAGHLDLVERGLRMCSELTVGVFHNPDKGGLFSIDERLALLRTCLPEDPRLRIETFEGLVVEYCKSQGIQLVLRGLRNPQDFGYEFQMACTNHQLAPEVETVFLAAAPRWASTSSSLIKDIARHGGDVSAFVPEAVARGLRQKFS